MTQKRILQFSPESRHDMLGHIAYLKQEASPRIAQRFVQKVQQSTHRLLQIPGMGSVFLLRERDRQQIHSFTVSAPFGRWILFYTVTETEVRIERVVHGYQDLTKLFM